MCHFTAVRPAPFRAATLFAALTRSFILTSLVTSCLSFSAATQRNAIASPQPRGCIVLGLHDPTTVVDARYLGKLEISENPFPYPGDDLLDSLRSMATSRGANLVKIVQVTQYRRYSPVTVVAWMYSVGQPRKYQPWIDWSPNRRLTGADFHASSPPGGRPGNDRYSRFPSSDSCDFYLLAHDRTKTRFYTRFGWLDPKADTTLTLEHEQGVFDLCEFYRRQLDTALRQAHSTFFTSLQRSVAIYRQIYGAYLDSRRQYEEATDHGLDQAQQDAWTRRIASGELPRVKVLTDHQLTEKARSLPPPSGNALVYIIRPNHYNTAFWKRLAVDPYYTLVFPCEIALFVNFDTYTVSLAGFTQGPLRPHDFVWQYAAPGLYTITSNRGKVSMTLPLESGQTYYVKMKIIERRFLAGARPEWELLSEQKGRYWLARTKLAANWNNFNLPIYPFQLY